MHLQLQLGTDKCLLDLSYERETVAPLSWVKMLWGTVQLAGVEIHLKSDVFPHPRRRDLVLMELFMETIEDQEDLLSMLRVKGGLHAMFLSDIVTSDGRFIKAYALDCEIQMIVASKYKFPREEPTERDWSVWK